MVCKEAQLALDLGPQLVLGGPTEDWALIGGLLDTERAQFAEVSYAVTCIRIILDMATPHRRAKGSWEGGAEPQGSIGTRCTPLDTSLASPNPPLPAHRHE